MIYCIGMFVLGVVALTARGLYFDIFRLTEWGSVFVFLPAALLLFWVERWQQKQDAAFNGSGTGYTSRLSDRQSTGIKQIYRADTVVGSYRRTFKQVWHRWFVAFPKVENFFLNLVFDLSQRELRFEEKPVNDCGAIRPNGRSKKAAKPSATLKPKIRSCTPSNSLKY
ncbi:hypothetical protein [Exiguobacterium sp. R-39]|uniref:hypothetical protein n=1 Tax=Exiguobacterium sp. R-39 TaxID=3416708 RepID=UPI003CF6609F